MAVKNTLVNAKAIALSDKEKATLKADKASLSVVKAGSAADWRTFVERVNALDATFNQTGEYAGKRINNAATHEFGDQVAAFADNVMRGNISRIG